MDQKSYFGTIRYYDTELFKSRICEPSTLFLLGLEAVLTPSKEYSTIENRSSYIHLNREQIPEIFSKAYFYLYGKFSDDSITEIKYNCGSLKAQLNQITGTDSNRICPIIFHWNDDYSNTSVESYIEELLNSLEYAGYCKKDNCVQYIGKFGVDDLDRLTEIDEINKSIKELHEKKKFYSQKYKLFDNKAMYSYALGVLYGCTCLGYADSLIWRTDPSLWYDGEYSNLVKTAYTVFKFHYMHPICCIDNDPHLARKYKGIQTNKIWNFDNTQYNIKQDEINCTVLSVEDNDIIEKQIIYSISTGPQKPIPGSYLSDENIWLPLDSSVICNDPKRGIVYNNDKPVKRYIGHNEIEIKQAYKYSKNKYLSPTNEDTSFISDGNIGWINFDYNSYKQASDEYSPLTISEKDFEDLLQNRFNNAINKTDGSVVGYYFSDVTNDIHIYGIMNTALQYTEDGSWDFSNIDDLFTSLLSDVDFETYYYTELPDGYTVVNYYDLDHLIALYINNENPEFYYDGLDDARLIDKGYTLTSSVPLDAYTYDSELNAILEFNLRYNEDLNSYWSSEWDPKEWLPTFDESIYISTGSTISLYRNTELLFEDTATYNNSTFKYEFICNTIHTEYNLHLGFLSIDDLYNLGITDHACEIIETDPNGDPLVDEYGNFVVWLDPVTLKYWNGYVSAWQDSIPVRNNALMYDTSTGTVSNISDNEIDHEITLSDGTVVTYDEFYSYPYYRGVIRDSTSFKLFNPNVSKNILQCYFDYKFGNSGRYCVQGIFENWMTFDEVHSAGYRFVNSESTLYDGDLLVPVIVDDDSSD